LAVKLYLPRLVLHQLRLIAPFYRTQLFRTAVREQPSRQRKREKPHYQKDSQNYVKEAQSPETVKHGRLLRISEAFKPEHKNSGQARHGSNEKLKQTPARGIGSNYSTYEQAWLSMFSHF
jgi:hypothetical protein